MTRLRQSAREKLIVALDFWDIADARKLVRDLGDEVSFYKVGLGLQLAGGDEFAKELIRQGKRVFLDYKYYDIEETIKTAVRRAAELDVDFLTVHGAAGILKAAAEGRGAVEAEDSVRHRAHQHGCTRTSGRWDSRAMSRNSSWRGPPRRSMPAATGSLPRRAKRP